MALYAGDSCDGDLEFIACSFTIGGVPRFQRSDLQPGTTYWIRAYYPNDEDPGEFPICATGPTEFPPGDCVYLLETYANGGNGWQGATVAAMINGTLDSTYTCSGYYSGHLIGLHAGDTLALTYTQGSNENGNSYRIRYGTIGPGLYDDNYTHTEGTVFTLENACTLITIPPVDCPYRVPVCSDTSFVPGAFTGVVNDLMYNNAGCLSGMERSGTWIELLIAEGGALGFTITPESQVDIDFALWGPSGQQVCPPPDDPVRCSYAISMSPDGATGLLASETDLSESAGGNAFVDTVHVAAGERYVLYIDNFSWNGISYALTFQLTEGAALECAPLPEAAFASSDNSVQVNEPVDFTDLSTGAPFSWLWNFSGANASLSLSQSPQGITYPLPGCYDVNLTTTNIAGSDATTHVCEVEVSVSASVAGADVTAITARLGNGVLVIERPGRTGSLNVSLMDASGRLVDRFVDRNPHIVRELNALSPGCYTLMLADAAEVLSTRLLVLDR
jgi:hypothetical protein